MKTTICIALLFASIPFAGCASPEPAPENPAVAVAEPTYPVITKLVGRRHTITISAGPSAALYSVQAADGRTLVSLATLEQLRDRHAEYFEMIKPVVALDTGGLTATATAAE